MGLRPQQLKGPADNKVTDRGGGGSVGESENGYLRKKRKEGWKGGREGGREEGREGKSLAHL